MKRLAPLVLLALFAGGCYPEVRTISWTPDGSKGLMVSQDKLYSLDADGKLTHLGDGVDRAAWVGDGKQVVVARVSEVKTWKDLAKELDEPTTLTVTILAKAIRMEILERKGKTDLPFTVVSEPNQKLLLPVLLYLRDNLQEGLPQIIGEEKWEKFAEVKLPLWKVLLCDASPGLKVRATLATMFDCTSILPSPDGKFVALVGSPVNDAGPGSGPGLFIAQDGRDGLDKLADDVNDWPAWTPDGSRIVYAKASGQYAEGVAGDIHSTRMSGPQDSRTGTLGSLWFMPQVRVFPAGKDAALFSSMKVTLPRGSDDSAAVLSKVTTKDGKNVVEVLDKVKLPEDIVQLELSPDGRHVAVVTIEAAVALTRISDGKVLWAQKGTGGAARFVTMPSWRTNDQLLVICPPKTEWNSSAHNEAVLLEVKGDEVKTIKVLSKDWPAKVKAGLLLVEPPKTQPRSPGPTTTTTAP